MLVTADITHYKQLQTDLPPCEPMPQMHLKLIKKVCIIFKSPIKKAAQLLSSYDKEYCNLAPFFYSVARYAETIIDKKSVLKGVAIGVAKDSFNPDKLKKLRSSIADLYSYFKKIAFSIVGSCIVTGIFTIITCMAGLASTITNNQKAIIITTSITAFFGVVLCTMLIVMVLLRILVSPFIGQLKTVINEDIGKHFNTIYDQLQFVRQEGDQFLYDIDREKIVKEYESFCLAEKIYKDNELRKLKNKKRNSQRSLLNNPA